MVVIDPKDVYSAVLIARFARGTNQRRIKCSFFDLLESFVLLTF